MTSSDGASEVTGSSPPVPRLRGKVLWVSGLATVLVASIVAVTGVVVFQGVVGLELPSPTGSRSTWSTAGAYAVIAAVFTLLATGVLHLLSVAVPRPTAFFNWILGACAVLGAAWPFTTSARLPAAFAAAAIDVVVVCAVWSLLAAARRRAIV